MIKIYKDLNYAGDEEQEFDNNDSIIKTIVENFEEQNRVLLYGAVQSGKTKNIVNLIKKLNEADKFDYIFYIVGDTDELKKQNYLRLKSDLEGVVDVYDAKKASISEALDYILDDKTVIVSLKQYLSSIVELLLSNWRDKRVLIIDDEGDHFTLSDKNMKLINQLVAANIPIVSCTATPFLNLYFAENIYNSYQKLTPNMGYCGVEAFNDNIEILSESIINDKRDLYLKTLIEWATRTHKNNLNSSQILFNFSIDTNRHEEIFEAIFKICQDIIHGYINLSEESERLGIFDVDSDGVIDVIKRAQESGIKISNNTTKGVDDHILNNKGIEIIIGGVYLSRGITYENLISEVLITDVNKIAIHTIVQRARWCGYRENKDLIKIYLNSKAKESFDEAQNIYKITLNHNLNSKITYSEKIREVMPAFERLKI